MSSDEKLKEAGAAAAIGTSLGVASSFLNTTTPHTRNAVANMTAQGGRVATDAVRHSLRNGASVAGALGAGAAAVGTLAAGGVSAAAAATTAAVVVAAPVVAVGAVVGLVGYGLYKGLNKIFG